MATSITKSIVVLLFMALAYPSLAAETVTKNPFAHNKLASSLQKPTDTQVKKLKPKKRRTKIDVRGIVISGGDSVAFVNDAVVKVDEEVQGYLVTRITQRFVYLTKNNKQYQASLYGFREIK